LRAGLSRFLRLPSHYFETKALSRFFRKERVRAVLAEYGPTGVALMDACVEARVPLIVHFHGYDAYREDVVGPMTQRYRRMFDAAAAIIAVSRDMQRQLVSLGAPAEKIFYCPCGADTSLFCGADPESAPPTFVAVGRFVDKKAPHLTLLAFRKVLDACPEARLIMFGDGILWEACKQMSRVLAISDVVDFLGARPHGQVAAAMLSARAFVQHSVRTSYGDSEGTPVGVLEASAAGLPVVTTKHAGINDVILHGQTGFLVEEGDVEGMAEHMVRLARDPLLAATMGKRGRERICAEFSMEKSIQRLWRIIEAAIASAQP